MKTITAAAVLMMLAVPVWADEPAKSEANTNEPIMLSEAEMDGVTAGAIVLGDLNSYEWYEPIMTSDRKIGMVFQSYALYPHMAVKP